MGPRMSTSAVGPIFRNWNLPPRLFPPSSFHPAVLTPGSPLTSSGWNHSQHTYMHTATNVIFSQMSAKQGFKKYGERAVAAMIKEFTQLNDGAVPGKPVVVPIDVSTLTPLEKRKALPAINLIKEKFGGDLKGRTCADGSRQRKYLKPDPNVEILNIHGEGFRLVINNKVE